MAKEEGRTRGGEEAEEMEPSQYMAKILRQAGVDLPEGSHQTNTEGVAPSEVADQLFGASEQAAPPAEGTADEGRDAR